MLKVIWGDRHVSLLSLSLVISIGINTWQVDMDSQTTMLMPEKVAQLTR